MGARTDLRPSISLIRFPHEVAQIFYHAVLEVVVSRLWRTVTSTQEVLAPILREAYNLSCSIFWLQCSGFSTETNIQRCLSPRIFGVGIHLHVVHQQLFCQRVPSSSIITFPPVLYLHRVFGNGVQKLAALLTL